MGGTGEVRGGMVERLLDSHPQGLRMAISAGIDLFPALIALEYAGIATERPAMPVALGDLEVSGASADGLGFITYAVVEVHSGKGRDRSPAVAIIGLPFVVEFAFDRGPQ